MARVYPPFPISGSIGPITYACNGQTNYIKMKNHIPEHKWRTHKDYARSRENAQNFGGAAKVACRIYSTLTGFAKHNRNKVHRPYAHNHITARILRQATKTARAADHYDFKAVLPALQGLNLSHDEAPSRQLTIQPIGPGHCPHKIRINGIREAADQIPTNGNSHLEFRVQLIRVTFPEAKFNPHARRWQFTSQGSHLSHITPKSDWIPVDFVPREGISLNIATDTLNSDLCSQNSPTLVFLQLEWQEFRHATPESPKPLTKNAIVRLAALQYSDALAEELAKEKTNGNTTQTSPSPLTASLSKTLSPEAYLKKALQALHHVPDNREPKPPA